MQQPMKDKKNEWTDKSQNLMDRAVNEVKNLDADKIRQSATEITTRVRDASGEYYDDAVAYIRDNPVKAAFGIVAVGFFAGLITGWTRKSA